MTKLEGSNPQDELLDFDPEALRDKYRLERDKRIRPDGLKQYAGVTGDFKHYVEDPHVEAGFTREPIIEQVEVAIVGAGFAGLSAAAQLRQKGIENIRILEKGGDFGGTWYWNRYPGVQCDIESYIYLPLLEETGYVPTERYAHGAEIFEHAKRIARHYDLYKDAYFQTDVTELRWLDEEKLWLISTNRDDQIKARFIVQTNGILDRPKLPAISGIDDYKGHTFHTSRWDYKYTGGDSTGGLHGLSDKRVAVIGTGATAIQVVPYVARYAKHLYVVQRTPSSVDDRRNKPTDPEWIKTLTPGWQKKRRDNFVSLTSGGMEDEDLVSDGWTDAVRNLGGFVGVAKQDMPKLLEMADFKKMNQVRARVDKIIQDKKVAESLKPWYRQFCKRPTFNDEYLPAFNRTTVTLIDTEGRGPDRFTENGIEFNGRVYEVDCVIFATGFEYGNSYAAQAVRSGHSIVGRGGKSLVEEWKNGLRTFHGFYSTDFPNLFHMGGSQNGLAFISTYYLDEQAEHIAEVLAVAKERNATLIEPTMEAEMEWVATIRAKTISNDFKRDCTPGAYNNEGKVGESFSRSDETYGGGPIEFYKLVREWRKNGMKGLLIE